jgi:mono/diheme cytochrome c family protein
MRTHVVVKLTLVLVGAAAVFATGCGSSNSPSAPSGSTNTVTFSTQIQQQIFNPACVACHTDDGRTPSSNLNLKTGVSIANLVNVASVGKAGATRVVPGNPSGSYLIQKLEGAPDIVGLRMPRNGPPFLTTEQIALIRQWIQNGAPNN